MLGIDKHFYPMLVTVLANAFEATPHPFVLQPFIGAERLLGVDFFEQLKTPQSGRLEYGKGDVWIGGCIGNRTYDFGTGIIEGFFRFFTLNRVIQDGPHALLCQSINCLNTSVDGLAPAEVVENGRPYDALDR